MRMEMVTLGSSRRRRRPGEGAERRVGSSGAAPAQGAPPFPHLASIIDRVTIHRGDVTDLDDVRRAFDQSGAESVIHLAAVAVPTLATADPVAAVRLNVLG